MYCVVFSVEQIAKNTAFPANGVYQPCNAAPDTRSMDASDAARHSAHAAINATTDDNNTRKTPASGLVANGGSNRRQTNSPSGALPPPSPTQCRLARTSVYGSGVGSGRVTADDDGDCDSDDPVSFLAEQVQTGIEVGREAVCPSSHHQGTARSRQSHASSPAKAAANVIRCANSSENTSAYL